VIVAFDTYMLTEAHRGVGIYQYAKNLFLQFGKLTADDDSLSMRYFVAPEYSEKFLLEANYRNLKPALTSSLNHDSLWRMGLVNFAAAAVNADLVFSPAPKILPFKVPAVVTIHDVMPAKLPPGMLDRRTVYSLIAQFWIAAKYSKKIITDSHHSKKDIVETFGIDPDKIAVVYLGYETAVFNTVPPDPNAQELLLKQLGITRPYIIHHGLVQSRKNLLRLIRAYKILQNQWKGSFDLVLAGGIGHGAREMQAEASSLTEGRVIFTGPLSDERLGMLLKKASLAVIPSLYEGFCLPIVEAMASGIPTIGANNSCIPEVSGSVLRYFDAYSEEEMASVMDEVLSSSDLQCQLKQAGLQRASEFTWEKCARETLKVLTSECAQKG
jgi:glycosyltransferase involved in cell wall biosynthesis